MSQIAVRLSMWRRFRAMPWFDWRTASVLLLPSRAWPVLTRRGWWAREKDGSVEVRLPNGDVLAAPASLPNPAASAIATYFEACYGDQYEVNERLSAGDIVIDAGAHFGAFTLLASRMVGPEGRVIAIEPVPECVAALRHVVEANALTNVEIVAQAVSSYCGEMTMDVDPNDLSASSLCASEAPAPQPGKTSVPVTTIDILTRDLALQRVDAIKMDLEGGEGGAIRGAARTVSDHRPLLLISAYHRPSDRTVLPELIEEIGPEYTSELRRAADWTDEVIHAQAPIGGLR